MYSENMVCPVQELVDYVLEQTDGSEPGDGKGDWFVRCLSTGNGYYSIVKTEVGSECSGGNDGLLDETNKEFSRDRWFDVVCYPIDHEGKIFTSIPDVFYPKSFSELMEVLHAIKERSDTEYAGVALTEENLNPLLYSCYIGPKRGKVAKTGKIQRGFQLRAA